MNSLIQLKKATPVFLIGLALACFALAPSATAQIQTTGTPGSPDATTTIPGNQLPPPELNGPFLQTGVNF